MDAEQPKVSLERKLNDILLSEDGWLAEMYLAAENRILSPNKGTENTRVLSLKKDIKIQTTVPSASQTVKQENIITP